QPPADAMASTTLTKPRPPAFTDQVFGRIWPESGLGPQPKLLIGALLLGLVAAITLPDRRIGLAAGLVALLSAGLLLWVSKEKRPPWAIACVAVGIGLAAMTVLRAAEWIAVLSMLLAALLLAVTVTRARSFLSIPLSAA